MLAEVIAMALGTAAAPAAKCKWVTQADVNGLRVGAIQDEATERSASHLKRASDDALAHTFGIRVTREARGAQCLRVNWQTAPRGRAPASAADFPGHKWPRGTIELPAWPTRRDLNPPIVEIEFSPRDDAIPERNETLGLELLDQNGRIIWGSEVWSPVISGGSVIWRNDEHRNGVTLTVHDVGRVCSAPSADSGFTVVNRRERSESRQYWPWPGLWLTRPNRPITQCEVVRWRLALGGARPLGAGDFAKGVFPSGTLRFSSLATGSDDQDDALPIKFNLRRGVHGRGRTVRVIVDSARGNVTDRTVTLH